MNQDMFSFVPTKAKNLNKGVGGNILQQGTISLEVGKNAVFEICGETNPRTEWYFQRYCTIPSMAILAK